MGQNKQPRVSIIIPCKKIGEYAEECVRHCTLLDYGNFEIIVLPDENVEAKELLGAIIIETGDLRPAQKREIGVQHSSGEIIAFIDDDAFPTPKWLMSAVNIFEDENVGAVGGPAVTPDSDSLLLQASGAVYQSYMGGGPYAYRYQPGDRRNVDDYPTCNLLVRKKTFVDAGGFDTNYWPGEDTILCRAITMTLKEEIIYEPKALVYHHRRNVFNGHLKQVASYALHRGFFVKKFPETSRRVSYFLPSLLFLGIIVGLPGSLVLGLSEYYFSMLGLYLVIMLLSSVRVCRYNVSLLLITFVGTILTQITYGAWFLKGLITKSLNV
ncbi:glycosyltransferase [SAR202 cluster bacterium AD-802-E10_MRT_200m]|nr:glycosyltransferase [SAR202 cluster bacterium AD-802-E10_MRT_200m]